MIKEEVKKEIEHMNKLFQGATAKGGAYNSFYCINCKPDKKDREKIDYIMSKRGKR